ncbi:MAG: 4Fe-4S binding protein [Candidatus Riflebacteria bacterium]|nr:4Fe-4S binding protein [Candidatus Riflebacteria bacterium]
MIETAVTQEITNEAGRSNKLFSSRLKPPVWSFLLTALILGAMQYYLPIPMLLFERYLPNFGWFQVVLMALYAAWLTGKFLNPSVAVNLRPRIWLLFSLAFFAQLFLGLAGFEKMLMTGKLHLPVPALIIAGPLFRGRDFFMPILFFVTALLVGPAWCSHLCYLGAWDDCLSRRSSKQKELPAYFSKIRLFLLALVVIIPLVMRFMQVGWLPALVAVALFGLVGVAVMLTTSRRNGLMAHCISYCPVGLVGNWLGRLSLFRVRIGDKCSECQHCRKACRYNALSFDDIKRRRPGSTCTLCGDCIAVCQSGQINYCLPLLPPQSARAVFLVLIISLHTVFLAVARI